MFSGTDRLCCIYLSSAFCICVFLLLTIPMLGSLLPGLFLGVIQIGIGAPSFLIDSSVGEGAGGMVNWAQNLVMVSTLPPNRPW